MTKNSCVAEVTFNSLILLEIVFSSNLKYAKLQNVLPIKLNHSGPSGDTKTSKFLPYNFSQYNFEKLIWTLQYFQYVVWNCHPQNAKSILFFFVVVSFLDKANIDNLNPILAYLQSFTSNHSTCEQSFPYENYCKCCKKLVSTLWPVLFTLTYFNQSSD